MITRNFARYGAPSYFYKNLEEFENSDIPSGTHSIVYGDFFLDLLVENRGGETTIVIFHAAADPATTSLPVFVGQKITDLPSTNVIFVSDPSLDLHTPIGWFSGDEKRPFQKDLPRVLKSCFDRLGSRNCIFQGCSAGGFAALLYSHFFPNSLAIPVNPQTNIFNYHSNKVEQYLESCWSGISKDDLPIISDLIGLYSNGFPNYVAYLQNKRDSFHIEKHYSHWKSAFIGEYGSNWKLLTEDWGEGHSAPPHFLQSAILQYAVEAAGNWETVLTDPIFDSSLSSTDLL